MDVALEVIAIHRRIGGHLHRELDEGDLIGSNFAKRKAIFQLAGVKPQHLCAEAIRVIKCPRCICLPNPCVIGDDTAFTGDAIGRRIAADGQMHGQCADAFLKVGREPHTHRVDPPGAELHGAANARMNFGGDEAGFLELTDVERGGGDGQAQRLGQFIDIHRPQTQQRKHPDTDRGRKRFSDGA